MKTRLITLGLLLIADISPGQTYTKIIDTDGYLVSPVWSPNGDTIAFVCATGRDQIYFYSLSDGTTTRLSSPCCENKSCSALSWSMDGQRVTFSVFPGYPDTPEIYCLTIGEETPLQVTAMDGFPSAASWSPDGSEIIYSWTKTIVTATGASLDRDLFRLQFNEGSTPRRFLDTSDNTDQPSYSPDGGRIAFTSGRDGYEWESFRIYVLDLSRGRTQQITTGDGWSRNGLAPDDYGPQWSPDGRWIAFYRLTYDNPEDPDINLFLVPSGGGSEIPLTETVWENGYHFNACPSWSPDGQRIVYARNGDIWMLSDFWETVESHVKTVTPPDAFLLEQNYPNPFNATTTITYRLSRPARVELKVYDLLGHEIAALADGHRDAGLHTETWDAGALPTGIYVCRLKAGDRVAALKLLLQK